MAQRSEFTGDPVASAGVPPAAGPDRPSTRVTLRVTGLGGLVAEGLDVAGLLLALRDRPGLVALDSAGGDPVGWSIVGFDPAVPFGAGDGPRDLVALGREIAVFDVRGDVPPGPFHGGFLGALAYDMGVRGDDLELPAPAWPGPMIAGGLYGSWVVVEHGTDGEVLRADLVRHEEAPPEVPDAAALRERFRTVIERRAHAAGDASPAGMRGDLSTLGDIESRVLRATSTEEHMARIERLRGMIAEGELYQANLSHRMTAPTGADAMELYQALRVVNPAPYMGFLRFALRGGDHAALLSASPELLLELEPGDGGEGSAALVARTRPIKGTIGRGDTPEEDRARIAELLASAKDRAELAMIVDLERNDLGRVAVPGGVTVAGFPTVETYATVHHLVADVGAEIQPGLGAVDVVASLFPGGSITGAPKLRSMEAIAELEGEGRGFFTGSLGFIDVRGAARLNILIRTMVHRTSTDTGHGVSFHVGGGITWGSDPAAEDRETLWKAAGLLAALDLAARSDLSGGH